jgi:glyoxylase-like metal-dependent hydrolase (beta-lactamase superfamily II)
MTDPTIPTMASYIASRQVGDATVTIISDATGLSTIIRDLADVPEAAWRREVEADANGDVRLGYNVAHVRIGAASILVDLGFDDPSPSSQWKAPRHLRTPGVPAGLAAIGVRPEDITHVLITHSHGDHVAGGSVERGGRRVPRYPNARHVLNRLDWEGLPERARPDAHAAIHLGTIERFGLLDLVDGDAEIAPGVTLVHAPGETPGHSLVRVRSRGETFYFLGDLFHHPVEVAHLDWVAKGRDAARMRASRERLVADALASDAVLVATHFPFPPFGRIKRAAEGACGWAAP